MATLLTGGGGKTSLRLAKLFQNANLPFLLASRRGQAAAPAGAQAVKFDWEDESTYSAPFEHKLPGGEKITSVYIVSPTLHDPINQMRPFIDLAVQKYGVKRFVLLSGANVEYGGMLQGKVWQYLVEQKIDYCMLKPTWFMENFSEGMDTPAINGESKLYVASGDNKIPFIATRDIAAVAFKALTAEKSPNTDYMILGPESLTHKEVAAKISKGTGRTITHVDVSVEERVKRLKEVGLNETIAGFLANMEATPPPKGQDVDNGLVLELTGQKPQTFDEFVAENKSFFAV